MKIRVLFSKFYIVNGTENKYFSSYFYFYFYFSFYSSFLRAPDYSTHVTTSVTDVH